MDERQERIGRNEALFREVNERVKDVNESFSLVTERGDFICECGDESCTDRFTMPLSEYEALRADPTTFAVVPGHDIPDVEDVVRVHGEYHVVMKQPGGPAVLAGEQDPRS